VATVRFTLQTGDKFTKTVDSAERAIVEFTQGADPFRGPWIEVDGGTWISRGAIVSVEPAGEAFVA
jgi:hypothetical protein